jgi:hypothetical protein
MKKLSIVKKAYVQKCLKSDIKDGKEWCIYKEDKSLKDQDKGFPKHFKTKELAEKYLQQMEMFKSLSKK